jgi:hypothetical protein
MFNGGFNFTRVSVPSVRARVTMTGSLSTTGFSASASFRAGPYAVLNVKAAQ